MKSTSRRDSKGRILQLGESQEKNGRYKYRYTDSKGERRSIYSWRLTEADPVPYGKRATESLREMERKVISLSQRGIVGANFKVWELVERYVALKPGVKHNTRTGYKFVLSLLKKEEFGYRKVDEVRTSDAKMFLIGLQRDGKGSSTIHAVRGVLRPAFQMAVDDDLIVKNPFGFELQTVVVNDSRKREALSERDEKRFLDFVKNDKYYCKYYDPFLFLFRTGLRISEFCGLTVRDIDMENEVIDVNHQLQRTNDMKYIIESTKTSSGTRKIPMTPEVKEICERILKGRKKPKKEPTINGYGGFLYFDKEGKPMVALHWEKYMEHARDKYNMEHAVQLPPITPHICRHTFCSNMARKGISPKTLQYLMGHSEIAVTMNVYTHLGLDDARLELQKLNEAKQEIAEGFGRKNYIREAL